MSDTYNYTSGSPFDGLSGVLAAMNGGNCNNRGFAGGIMDIIGLVIVAGLFGGFGNGYGPFGGMGRGAAGGCGCGSEIPAATAALVGQQNVADKTSAIATGVDAVAGIVTANGVKLETVKDQNAAGFANLNTHLCEGFHNVSQQFTAQTMQGMNMHNATTALLNDIRYENAKCCCENRNDMNSKFCELGYRIQADKADVLRAVAFEGEATRTMIKDIQTQQLQERLAKAEAQLSQNAQTASIVGAIQANCAPKCGSGCAYGYGPCAPCGVNAALQRGVDTAIGERIGEILFPTATTAA